MYKQISESTSKEDDDDENTNDFMNFTVPYNELSPRIAVLSKFFVALTISSTLNCLHTGKSSEPNLDVSEMYPNSQSQK